MCGKVNNFVLESNILYTVFSPFLLYVIKHIWILLRSPFWIYGLFSIYSHNNL
nr:MAG TPA: hypothetical protein [Caudoviricetes sp.]